MHASGRTKLRVCVDFLVKFIIITLTKGVLKVLGNLTVGLALALTCPFECNGVIVLYTVSCGEGVELKRVGLHYVHRQSPDLLAG